MSAELPETSIGKGDEKVALCCTYKKILKMDAKKYSGDEHGEGVGSDGFLEFRCYYFMVLSPKYMTPHV